MPRLGGASPARGDGPPSSKHNQPSQAEGTHPLSPASLINPGLVGTNGFTRCRDQHRGLSRLRGRPGITLGEALGR